MLARFEARALANLVATPSGRRELVGLAVTTASTAFGAAIIAHRFLGNDELVALIRDDGSGTLERLFLGLCFAPGLFLAFTISVHVGRTGLFERGEAALVLVSPAPRATAPILVFWRCIASSTLLGIPMTIVPLALSAHLLGLGAGPVLLAVPAMVVTLALPIAIVIGAHVTMMRFFASPRVKLVAQALVGLLGTTGAALGMTGFVIDGDDALRFAEAAATRTGLPAPLATAAALVRPIASLGEPGARRALMLAPAFLAASFVLLRVAGRLYARAYENSILSARPVFRSRSSGAGASWPTSVTASVVRRDLADVQRDPGGFFLYLFLAVFVVAATLLDFGKGGSGGPFPEDVRRVFTLTTQWLLLSVIVSMLLTPSITMGDRTHRSLLACSPARRSALLLGRLPGIASVYAWVLLVQVVAAVVAGDPPIVVLAFSAIATAGAMFCIGLILGFGTITSSSLGEQDSSVRDIVAVVLPQLLVCAGTITLFFAMGRARSLLRRCYDDGNTVGPLDPTATTLALLSIAWGVAMSIAIAGFAIGTRNYARALAPR